MKFWKSTLLILFSLLLASCSVSTDTSFLGSKHNSDSVVSDVEQESITAQSSEYVTDDISPQPESKTEKLKPFQIRFAADIEPPDEEATVLFQKLSDALKELDDEVIGRTPEVFRYLYDDFDRDGRKEMFVAIDSAGFYFVSNQYTLPLVRVAAEMYDFYIMELQEDKGDC